ncbi:MAG: ribonuclease D [Alphaproteobacteria bacterium]|nr:ribonuclease D [Alphaproteobacteria bacterium]
MTATDIPLITESAELLAFCTTAAHSRFITIDTEFIRERTYYPKLCLIQIACDQAAAMIDPLVENLDMTPLHDLLNDDTTLKVFHAARQDLEIFYHMLGCIPHPIFDTQVAAMVCGFGESISYDGLVQQITGQKLDKSSRFTNWEHRPLTQKQRDYAIADVTHLRHIFLSLEAQLESNNRIGWIEEEMAVLLDPVTYDPHPEDAWKRLKTRTRAPKFLAALQAAAAWRERMAQTLDQPRGRILKDDTLADIAASHPKDLDGLYKLRGMNKGLDKSKLQELLDAVHAARELPRHECPQMPELLQLPPEAGAAIELLRVLLKRQCDRENVAQKLVANRSDLEHIAAGLLDDTALNHGWRKEVFGRHAEALMQGKLAMALDPQEGAVVLLTQDDMAPQQ